MVPSPVMAMTECLEAMPEDYARRGEVISLLNKAMESVVKYQDKKTGVWYDVMDVKDPRNYLESTASSMFAYVLLKGYRKGYLSEKFRDAGVKAYKGIIDQFIQALAIAYKCVGDKENFNIINNKLASLQSNLHRKSKCAIVAFNIWHITLRR